MREVSKRLAVPLRPQLTDRWCWAASVQMVSEYLGKPVDQCALVGPGCCGTPTPKRCIRDGEPGGVLQKQGFTSKQTRLLSALTWKQIVAEIDANRPFIIGWNLIDPGVHFMVGVGYQVSRGKRYVLANNPLPVGTGTELRIAYESYPNGAPGGTHWHDVYQIKRSDRRQPAAKPNARTSLKSAPIPAFLSTALTRAAPVAAKLLPAALKLHSIASSARARLGAPIAVVDVALSAPRSLDDVDAIVATRALYPIEVDGGNVTVLELAKGDRAWTSVGYSQDLVYRRFDEARRRHAALLGISPDHYFAVVTHRRSVDLIGVVRDEAVRLIAVADVPLVGWSRDQELPASDALKQLQVRALAPGKRRQRR